MYLSVMRSRVIIIPIDHVDIPYHITPEFDDSVIETSSLEHSVLPGSEPAIDW